MVALPELTYASAIDTKVNVLPVVGAVEVGVCEGVAVAVRVAVGVGV